MNNNVVAYLDAYGYAAYIDESAMTYDYAYVLSMGTDGDQYDSTGKGNTVYARLVLTDGTIIKVETDAKASQIGSDADGDGVYTPTAKGLLNHIVSYSVDKNDVYTLTARDLNEKDKMQGTVGIQDASSPKELSIEGGVASFVAAGDSYTANSSTVFIVADSDEDYDDYDFTVYTGVKNVPDIEGMTTTVEGKKIPAKVDVAATKDGVAKVVYIEDADVSGLKNVIFARAASDAKLVKDSEIGDYYEINAVVDGETVTLQVKENSTAADKLVEHIATNGADMLKVSDTKWIVALESITENSDGLVTNVRIYEDNFKTTNDDGWWTGSKTDDAVNETVSLGGSRYAWTDEVVVVRYNYKGDFEVSRISSIKEDGNDEFLAVMDGRVINGVCIVEKAGMSGSGSGSDIDVTVPEGEFAPVDWNGTKLELRYYGDPMTDSEIKEAIEDVTGSPVERLNKILGTATLANGDVYPVNFTQIEQVALFVDGKIVDYADKNGTKDEDKLAVPGADEAKYLLDTKVGSDLIKGTGIKPSDDRELWTAYEVSLEKATAVAGEDKADIKDGVKYVADGEDLVITFTEAGAYKITNGEGSDIVEVEKDATKTISVNGEVKVEKLDNYQTEEQIESVVEAYEPKKDLEGCDIKVDGNTLNVTLKGEASAVKNTGLLDLVKSLVDAGSTVSVKIGGNTTEITAAKVADLSELKKNLLSNLAEVLGEEPVTIAVTVNNEDSGASVPYQVVITPAADGE